MKPGDIIVVRWNDALRAFPAWMTPEDARRHAPAECFTVGFLVEADRERLVVASSTATDHVGGVFAIPRDWVQQTEVLRSAADGGRP